MPRGRDPVEEAAEDDRNLHGIATWEPRSALDRTATLLYALVIATGRAIVVLAALAILVSQIALGGLSATETDPVVVALVVLSVVPALLLAGYVWLSDVTEPQPVGLLVATFVLGVLLATFAAVVNGTLAPTFEGLGLAGTVLFFYLVVAPVEEAVKLLAVRLHAYRHFSSVVDGAVYGAAAGLGFATIENYVYITRTLEATDAGLALAGAGGGIAAVRALAGPGHVIYSSIAGYYLGLAAFNREYAGPLVVKGLLVAAFVHGTYNVLVTPASVLLGDAIGAGDTRWIGFVVFVLAYDGLFALFLYRKLGRYGRAYRATRGTTAGPAGGGGPPDDDGS